MACHGVSGGPRGSLGGCLPTSKVSGERSELAVPLWAERHDSGGVNGRFSAMAMQLRHWGSGLRGGGLAEAAGIAEDDPTSGFRWQAGVHRLERASVVRTSRWGLDTCWRPVAHSRQIVGSIYH